MRYMPGIDHALPNLNVKIVFTQDLYSWKLGIIDHHLIGPKII
jgi:hypothetical protein